MKQDSETGRAILPVVVLLTEHLYLKKEEATAELEHFLFIDDYNIREQLL